MATDLKFGPGFRGRNPDILTCIANLSSDEIFTPPNFANQILDTLTDCWKETYSGENIWQRSDLKFLDPCSKSGVFLREITKRLISGLESEIPNLNSRVEHILKNQIYGIAITSLTAKLSRRSLYCSKDVSSKNSIVAPFNGSAGNIWFESSEHHWIGGKETRLVADEKGNTVEKIIDGKCSFCGASQKNFGRESNLETHAYKFTHSLNINSTIEEIFGEAMQFDVIIGNPPYQLSTEGHGHQARPIYHQFVEQAKKLEPRFISMITPSRWFTGGMGLTEFRDSMLSDSSLRVIEDFPDSNEVFPGTQIKGGVSYFLWSRDSKGECTVRTNFPRESGEAVKRPLLEPGLDVFIRYNEAISIMRKVAQVERSEINSTSLAIPEENKFMNLVSSIGAFGLPTTFVGKSKKATGDLLVHRNGGIGYIARDEVTKEKHIIEAWKIFIPRAGSGSDSFPHPILGKPFIGKPNEISSWTYLHIGPFKNEKEARNAITYITTKFFRFLVLLHKSTQDATKGVYEFVPMQIFSEPWTDSKLQKKYSLTDEEIKFIDKMVRPMELEDV